MGTPDRHMSTRRNADLRRHNSLAVIDILRQGGRMSRAELARQTTLSNQALADILSALVESGHAVEVSVRGNSRGRGRPALQYEYNADRLRVVSVYVGLRFVAISLCDGLGRPLAPRLELEPGWDPERVVAETAEHLDALVTEHRIPRERCHIAAVIHGVVDTATGIATSRGMEWEDVEFASMLSEAVSMPVTVHEASRAAAIAEHREGVAAGSDYALVLNVGPEIAATVVRHGEIEIGTHGRAGVLDGCFIPADGGLRRLDDEVGSFTLKALYNDLSDVPAEWMHDVFQRAAVGDRHAQHVIDVQSRGIAFACSWLMAILDPDLLVLGGALAAYSEQAKATLYSAIAETTDERVLRGSSIRFSTLGTDAWHRGGVHAALDHERRISDVAR